MHGVLSAVWKAGDQKQLPFSPQVTLLKHRLGSPIQTLFFFFFRHSLITLLLSRQTSHGQILRDCIGALSSPRLSRLCEWKELFHHWLWYRCLTSGLQWTTEKSPLATCVVIIAGSRGNSSTEIAVMFFQSVVDAVLCPLLKYGNTKSCTFCKRKHYTRQWLVSDSTSASDTHTLHTKRAGTKVALSQW